MEGGKIEHREDSESAFLRLLKEAAASVRGTGPFAAHAEINNANARTIDDLLRQCTDWLAQWRATPGFGRHDDAKKTYEVGAARIRVPGVALYRLLRGLGCKMSRTNEAELAGARDQAAAMGLLERVGERERGESKVTIKGSIESDQFDVEVDFGMAASGSDDLIVVLRLPKQLVEKMTAVPT